MSITLLEFSKSFVNSRIGVDCFVESYQELWRIEGYTEIILDDEDVLSEYLSTTACLADLYNPDSDREDYELDSDELKNKVKELLKNIESKQNK